MSPFAAAARRECPRPAPRLAPAPLPRGRTRATLRPSRASGRRCRHAPGASLAQPLINLKAIEANVEAQTARRDDALVAYRQTVQAAFRETHDALVVNRTAREVLAAQTRRRVELERALELADLRYRSGYSGYLDVLDAQRQLLQAQTLEIIAARDARNALVDLAKALGGGWSPAAFQAAQR